MVPSGEQRNSIAAFLDTPCVSNVFASEMSAALRALKSVDTKPSLMSVPRINDGLGVGNQLFFLRAAPSP